MTVLVTGGSGFVGSHVVDRLLRDGHDVRATVRPGLSPVRRAALEAVGRRRPGSLTLVEADLLAPQAFHDAARECSVVFHVASPFLMPEQITDPQRDLVEPALAGTRGVVEAVTASTSVRRLVLTSTVGAVFGDYADVLEVPDRMLRDDQWNTSSTIENNPYHYAKTVAERYAWNAVAGQDRWDLVTINPGLILGPTLVPGSSSGSLFLMDELFGGDLFFGAPDFAFTVVDVRDVADAHVAAASRDGAHGRYLLARQEMVPMLEIARTVRRRHRWRWRIPSHPAPDVAVRLLGPRFGLSRDYIAGHLGIRFSVDNRRSREELGVTYRPVEETVLDHYDAWRAVTPRR